MLNRKFIVAILCALAGSGYIAAFAQLEVSSFLKGSVAIIPLQVLALLYVFVWRSRTQKSKTAP